MNKLVNRILVFFFLILLPAKGLYDLYNLPSSKDNLVAYTGDGKNLKCESKNNYHQVVYLSEKEKFIGRFKEKCDWVKNIKGDLNLMVYGGVDIYELYHQGELYIEFDESKGIFRKDSLVFVGFNTIFGLAILVFVLFRERKIRDTEHSAPSKAQVQGKLKIMDEF